MRAIKLVSFKSLVPSETFMVIDATDCLLHDSEFTSCFYLTSSYSKDLAALDNFRPLQSNIN